MPLEIAIQMDPIERIHPQGDTTLALALEAQTRGHKIFVYEPSALICEGDTLFARGHETRFFDDDNNWFQKGAEETRALKACDVVLMRQDPPFNMAYITAAHLLETLYGKTLLINNPAAVRDAPEKIFPLRFPDLMPPTLVSRDKKALLDFLEKEKDVVFKPLYEAGGTGIVRAQKHDENHNALLDMLLEHYETPIVAQKFLKEIREGDKRVMLLEGAPVAVLKRVPQKGEIRANLHVGGRPHLSDMTKKENNIAMRVGAELKKRDIFFAGLDIIAEQLTEVNVTSPTGMREIKALGGGDIAAMFWERIEARLKKGAL